MNDREVIETCAEICGIELTWWHTAQDGWVCHNFDPLTDSNDERRVLEAVREWKEQPSLWFGYLRNLYLYGGGDDWKAFAKWHIEESKVGDISRAAAKAYVDGTGEDK